MNTSKVWWRTLGSQFLAMALFSGAMSLPAFAQSAYQPAEQIEFSPSQIFFTLFLMLGPLKLLVPFEDLTQRLDSRIRRRIARRAIFFSAAALMIATLIGRTVLDNFGISLPVLALTGGIILFLAALQTVMQGGTIPRMSRRYDSVQDVRLALMPIAYPIIVTPQGLAAVIVFVTLADSRFWGSSLVIGIVLLILILDWITMLFAATILRCVGTSLQIFGVVLGVTQVALGLQIILHNLSLIGLFAERAH